MGELWCLFECGRVCAVVMCVCMCVGRCVRGSMRAWERAWVRKCVRDMGVCVCVSSADSAWRTVHHAP